jgi:aminodeoxyfutalosine synthase
VRRRWCANRRIVSARLRENDHKETGVTIDAGRMRALEDKVLAGERLTYDDGVALYASDDMAWLGSLAHHVRTKLNGDRVMFNINRHLNLTNVCTASCAYCSFQRKPGEKDAYTMRVEEAVRLAKTMEAEQLTELHIVNGLHPTLPWRYYPRVLRELKAALPTVALKAFTATEIHFFEELSGMPAEEVLDELIDAGLESLTGGGRRDLRLGDPQADRRPTGRTGRTGRASTGSRTPRV